MLVIVKVNAHLVFILFCFCGLNVSNSESNSHLAHIYYFISVSNMYESNLFQVDVTICESDSLSDHMDCFVSME